MGYWLCGDWKRQQKQIKNMKINWKLVKAFKTETILVWNNDTQQHDEISLCTVATVNAKQARKKIYQACAVLARKVKHTELNPMIEVLN